MRKVFAAYCLTFFTLPRLNHFLLKIDCNRHRHFYLPLSIFLGARFCWKHGITDCDYQSQHSHFYLPAVDCFIFILNIFLFLKHILIQSYLVRVFCLLDMKVLV